MWIIWGRWPYVMACNYYSTLYILGIYVYSLTVQIKQKTQYVPNLSRLHTFRPRSLNRFYVIQCASWHTYERSQTESKHVLLSCYSTDPVYFSTCRVCYSTNPEPVRCGSLHFRCTFPCCMKRVYVFVHVILCPLYASIIPIDVQYTWPTHLHDIPLPRQQLGVKSMDVTRVLITLSR